MSRSVISSRLRLGAISLVIAGIFFVLYPALRPFSDEVSLQGATAFASPYWLAAHMLAMVAFTFLPLGLLALHNSLQNTEAENSGYWAVVLSIVGVGLTLPFYGGEANGLHAIGQEALRQQDAALLSLAGVIRSGPGLIMFLVGTLAACSRCNLYRNGHLEVWDVFKMERDSLCWSQSHFTFPSFLANNLFVSHMDCFLLLAVCGSPSNSGVRTNDHYK